MERMLADLLNFVYEANPGVTRVPLATVFTNLAHLDRNEVEHGLSLLDRANLFTFSIDRTELLLNPAGKTATTEGTAAALALGRPHIVERVRQAVVAIEVVNDQGDLSMGSGFFSESYPGWIATAGHVVNGAYKVKTVFDHDMHEIRSRDFELRLPAENGLDLALIRCPMPTMYRPLQTEWDLQNIPETGAVLVAGFPTVAGHDRHVLFCDAFLSCVTTRFGGGLKSLVISRVTSPGYSGGPVIDNRGIVIGIVEQENHMQDHNGTGIFVSAVPTPYLAQL